MERVRERDKKEERRDGKKKKKRVRDYYMVPPKLRKNELPHKKYPNTP